MSVVERPGTPKTREDYAALTRRTADGLLWVGCGKAARAILQVLVLAVLARVLAPADFGLVATAMIVIALSTIFSRLGIGPAIVQRGVLEPRHLTTGFVVSAALGVMVGGAVWLAAPWCARFFRMEQVAPIVRTLAWIFPINALGVVSDSILQRELRFRWLANLEVATYALAYGVLGVALAVSGAGVWALVAAQLAQAILQTSALLALRRPSVRGRPQWLAFQELLYFGTGQTAARFGNYLAHEGDHIVVGRWLGADALGLYGRGYSLMAMPANLLADTIESVLFPALSRVQDDPARLVTAYRRGLSFIALTMLPVSVVLLVLAPEVVTVVLGPRWRDIIPVFQVFAIGILFRTSYKMSDSVARASGAVYRRAWRQALYAALVFAGSWIGQRWGITGAALGVLIALLTNFALMAHLCLGLTGMSWRSLARTHVPAVVTSTALGAVVWTAAALARWWDLHPVAVIAAAGSAGVAAMLPMFRTFPVGFLGMDGLWAFDLIKGLLRTNPPAAQEAAAT
jgi:O-antigen/teichoic acid export membrane protein